MPQQFMKPQQSTDTTSHPTVQKQTKPQAHPQEDALDAVLDDISTALNENAEEYVSSFVQKGGQ
jgi:prokaryotic ubiquitin-like protein Pup